MGKRRYGFLTSWQWSYVKGQVDKGSMSKSRQRVEDYYIMKSFERAVEQFFDIQSWLVEKGFSDSKNEILKHLLRPHRGKSRGKSKNYMFRESVVCPFCDKRFSFDALHTSFCFLLNILACTAEQN